MDARVMIGAAMALRRYRARDRWTRAQLDAYQAEELRRLREFAYARSPFYRRVHDGLADRSLQELPVLTKATLIEYWRRTESPRYWLPLSLFSASGSIIPGAMVLDAERDHDRWACGERNGTVIHATRRVGGSARRMATIGPGSDKC